MATVPALRGASARAPRLLFILPLLLVLAACGMRPSGSGVAAGEDEPLDLALVPPTGSEVAPRRPLSADVVRKTAAETRALFGVPTNLRREPPGEVWQYVAEQPRCVLLLFFYPGETDSRLRVAHAQVLSRARDETIDDSDCLAALLKTTPSPRGPAATS